MLARFLIWALLALVVCGTANPVRRHRPGRIRAAAARRPPEKGELMVRDPVCGTFVLPSRSVSMRDRSGTHHFCSDRCRQAYQQR